MASVTIYSTAEASAWQHKPATNYQNALAVEPDPSWQWMAYMGFDVSSAPADVTGVSLHLYRPDDGVFSAIAVNIYRITSLWDSSTLTWNVRPSSTPTNGLSAVKLPERESWKSYDVMAAYRDAKAAGDGSFGFHIADKGSGRYKGPINYLTPGLAYLVISYNEPIAFAGVAISRRYGDKLYLSGKLNNIVASDEICIRYFRPEDGTVHNLPGNGLDYTYLKGTSGTYTFPDDACIPIWDDKFVSGHWEGNTYISAHYEDTGLPGLYYLLVDDVSGDCENPILERCRAAVLVIEPRYQYQVEFSSANLDSPEAVTMLEARRRQWARVTDKRVEPYGTDCFSVRLKYSSGWDDATALVWLCSAYQARTMAKFMPLPPIGNLEFTEYMEYFRGECSCAEYRESRKYGVPCVHIMAAYYHLNKKPPYCEYLKCP